MATNLNIKKRFSEHLSGFLSERLFFKVHLGNVDSAPEELEVLLELFRLVAGVEDGQLTEHAHVSSLQAQAALQQRHQLIKIACTQGTDMKTKSDIHLENY